MKQIRPHGGTLVNREAETEERSEFIRRASELPALDVNAREVSDLELIAAGAFSPLEGFLGKDDYQRVCGEMRLANGIVWSIPVTLSAKAEQAKALREGQDIALFYERDLLAVMSLSEKFQYKKAEEAQCVYQTTDEAHPGVRALYQQGEWLLGGKITLVNQRCETPFPEYHRTPKQTRALFQERQWRRVVAFQTRNPIHRAHEYIQKCALEICDGLLLHPIVGETKSDDIPADVRMRSYEAILSKYYPAQRAILSTLPAAMRYAGPREAIFHALIRKNYGCTHFIVGRDHAGVGNYYGTYDAHFIFDEFEPDELGITPLFFDHTFYCQTCGAMASSKTCPHESSHHIALSGTKVRELLNAGILPPTEFSRSEVAAVLIESYRASQSAHTV